jgi:hypothetical protein
MRRLVVATIGVGVLSFGVFILERFALTDILHGEPDLQLEWAVVNAAFLPVVLFHVLGLVCVVVALRRLGGVQKSVRDGAQEADAAHQPADGC